MSNKFQSQGEYNIALLRVLNDLEDGQARPSGVRERFLERYEDRIPARDFGFRKDGKVVIWQNKVAFSRQYLKEYGFLDSPARGVWRITEAGQRWLIENPNVTSLPRRGSVRAQGKRMSRESRSSHSTAPGVTLDMLERTREAMPADQFRQVWGPVYDQLLAAERAKTITTVTQTELGRRARRRLDEIHAFLRGQNASSPSAEVMCDWIHFCYALELYREAAALLPYVREDEVDAVTYKRAKRIADVCRSKLAG